MRRLSSAIGLALLGFLLAGCPSGGTPGIRLTINPLSIELNIGQTTTFAVSSTDSTDFFTWRTSNPAVVTVDNRGRVTAVDSGTARITAVSGRSNAQISANVTVLAPAGEVAQVAVSPVAATIAVGDTYTLEAASTREDPEFLWFSENEAVATVSANGVVTAVGPGVAVVNARGASPAERASATITVVEPAVHFATVHPLGANILAGETLALSATSSDPLDTFVWSSEAESTATVDANGVVTGAGPGGVVINARGTNSGATASAVITVTRPVAHRVNVSPATVTIDQGDTIRFDATTTRPGDSFAWSSSDTNVAVVDGAGRVTGLAIGTANIVAQGGDPDERGAAMVRVREGRIRIAAVRPLGARIPAGGSVQLSASSADASETFAWSSANEEIATVNATGLVSGVAPGEIRITAVGARTGATGQSLITVAEPIAHELTVSPSATAIQVGDTFSFAAASSLPGDRIVWSSSNTGAATVDSAGAVTGVGAGSATIRAEGLDSGAAGQALLTVTVPAEEDVTVRPRAATIAVGENVTLDAASTDASDTFTWASANPLIASVSPTGVVTGVNEGAVLISALGSSSAITGSATITVTAPPAYTVRVFPDAAALAIGDTLRLAASSTRAGDTIAWNTADSNVATVDSTGLVSAAGPGTVLITATGALSGASASATITVEEPVVEEAFVRPAEASIQTGETLALTAESSNALDAFTWASDAGGVASVDESGLVTGAAAGVATISATGTITGAAGGSIVTVIARVEHEVSVSPSAAALITGDTLQFNASTTREGDTLTWSSDTPSVAAVSPNGLVTAIGPGSASITAQGGAANERAVALITVVDPVAHRITLQPLGASIEAGDTVALAATSTDPSDTFAWSSSNGAIATVTSTGVVTGVLPGSAEVRVRGASSGVTAAATITVTAPAVHTVAVRPASPSLEVGQTVSLAATSTNPEDAFSWTSANVAVATVGATGTVTAVAPGQSEIVATGTRSGSSAGVTLTVVEPVTHTIGLDPAVSAIFVGATVALAAVSTDESDTFTWQSDNTAVATVNASGLVTGVGEGDATITVLGARSRARAQATVTVTRHSVSVAPGSLALLAGTTASLSAASSDSGEAFQWASSNTATATVSASGVVTGVAGGLAEITATGVRSGESASAEVSVRDGVVVNPPSGSLVAGETLQLGAQSTDSADTFTWSSSSNAVATVSPSGLVSGVGGGTVAITATGTRSGAAGSATISVVPYLPVTPSTATVRIGRIVPLFAPVSSIHTELAWSSADPSIAAVNQNGVVTGLRVGKVRITATARPGGATGYAEVTVLPRFPNALLFDGENEFTSTSRSRRNTEEQFRGMGCLEGIPDQYAGFGFTLRDEYYRKDISHFDEIWLVVKAIGTGANPRMEFASHTGASAAVRLSEFMPDGPIDNQYRLVRVPMNRLVTSTYTMRFNERCNFGPRPVDANFRFFVDEVWAVSLDSVDAEGGPLVGPMPAIDFGLVSVTAPAARRVTVRNIGASPLRVSGVDVRGGGSAAFSVTPSAFEVQPGAAMDVTVSFSPAFAGIQDATLAFKHNDTAFGAETLLPVRGDGMAPQLALSRSNVDFGAVPLAAAVRQFITFANTGNAPLVISSVALPSANFSAGTSNFAINPGDSVEFEITASPLLAGLLDSALTFQTNAPDSPTVSIPLHLQGIAAGQLGRLSQEAVEVTSSSATLAWGAWPAADNVRVLIGPEPPAAPGGPLPFAHEVASLPGTASEYTLTGLAAGVDAFVRIEVSALGVPLAAGTLAIQTPGGPGAALDNKLREVHLVAPNILQLVLTDSRVHSFREDANNWDRGIEEVIGYTGSQWETGTWTVRRSSGDEIPINNVYRHSVPIGAPYYEIGFGTLTFDQLLDVDHMIYLELAENIGSPEVLEVTGPSFDYEILNASLAREPRSASLAALVPFSDRYMTTPAIQVNQVGYSPAATKRYAYVSGWIGTGGPLNLSAFPAQAEVIATPADPLAPRQPVLSGLPISLRAAADAAAGTEVREISLAALPESDDTVYRVRIPGVGVSWPTRVSEEAVFEAYYHVARGLFHNRWAGDLAPEFTDWTRPADHGTVFTSEETNPWAFFPSTTPLTGERPLLGGHHDAGDFDIRIFHGIVAQMLMRAYELNESAFTDGQLIIPESGNGIPDFLDEALWSVAGWEYLQDEDGGVRIGAESHRHPWGIYPAHEDQLFYWTYSKDPVFTARCAGLFAQAAWLVQPYDFVRSHMLEQRAIAAYDYAIANGVDETAGGPMAYAAGELYRLTGEDVYRDMFIRVWDAFKKPWPPFAPDVFARDNPWTSSFTSASQPIVWDHVSAYVLSGGAVASHVSLWEERSRNQIGGLRNVMEAAHAHRNARPAGYVLAYGKGTAVGQYLFGSYAGMQLGNPSTQQFQDAFDLISLSADFMLGCNPAGISWITGLGSRSPQYPLHLDSLYYIRQGLGPVPGIPIYGPTDTLRPSSYYTYGARLAYPSYTNSPPFRRWSDVHTFVISNEFTVWENQAPAAQLFGLLVAPDMMPPEHLWPTALRE
ncbi:MAG: Ig-like domain-containing protein [Candidatus Hydrogenedentes bacterium]|nr:Ig-like domain-containing protein [Candidatus Hydrogenedentota bacterium]